MDDDIEARRAVLTAELWRIGHTITDPTFEGETARNNRIAELQAELAALPKPPVRRTGEAAGIIAITRVLGDRLVRAPAREPDPPEADPYRRFAKEMGWERY
jgi:hypothetical protein